MPWKRTRDDQRDEVMRQLLGQPGAGYELARLLKIKPATVYNWKRVPEARVNSVCQVTGLTRHQLRPDLFDKHGRRRPVESKVAAGVAAVREMAS
jgi:DNA-binding transcriptional regulator YdaS (Cro superfamily)